MRTKKLLILLGGVCLSLMLVIPLVVACAGPAPTPTPSPSPSPTPSPSPSPTPPPPPAAEVYELRMQHSWGAAENHFFEQYADIVREMTGGQVDISVYSDGELVSWDQLSDAVAAGTIDIGHTHPDYYEGVVPEGFLESAPYLWRTLDEEIAVIYEYGVGDIYAEALENTFGYHVLGFEPDDWGALMFTKEIKSLKDMKGCVIQILDPTGSILHDLAGASSTYLGPEEIYTALATGVLDGVEYGGAKAMSEMGFHEVAKFFIEPHHQISYFPFYFINADLYNELPANLQAILREAVRANGIYMRAFYAHGEAKALAMMQEEAGVTVCRLPDEDVEAIFQEALKWLENDYAAMSPGCQQAANACLEALRDFGRIS